MKKTLLVGLDAACWSFLDPLLQAGRLPNLSSLMASGTSGKLISTMPAWTPTAWSSIVTGKNPGKHGIFDMNWLRPGTYQTMLINSKVRLGTPFWKRLNDGAVRVGLVNVPFSHPFDPVDGFAVAGFGAPNAAEDIVYPPELFPWIEENIGHYEPWLRFDGKQKITPQARVAADIRHQATQVKIAAQLAEKQQVDVLVINLMVPDHANHFLPDMEGIGDAIAKTDEHLGELIASFKPDNIMVFSDHGSHRNKGDFLLHAWLIDQGYCAHVKRSPEERLQALNWILHTWLTSRWKLPGAAEKAVRSIARRLVTMLPDSRLNGFWKILEHDLPSAKYVYQHGEELDYSRSKVFVASSRSCSLYINQVGKYPDGIVPPEERQKLIDELRAKLLKVTDPETGKPLFANVHAAENIYTGPARDYAPDIVIDYYDSDWNIMAAFHRGLKVIQTRHRYFADNKRTFGHHSKDGIYVFSGIDFVSDPGGCESAMMDIPATLLYLYNIPIPDDYDGQVLADSIRPALLNSQKITRQPGDGDLSIPEGMAYSSEESDELIERLKALGYMD